MEAVILTNTPGIVSLRGLRKTFPGKVPITAVDGIDLDVPAGSIFGLLGPNGAGKTTTISVCTTRALPSAGTATIAGVDVVGQPAEARRHMGVVPQYNTLERSCTVEENIQFHCMYFGFTRTAAQHRTAELLEQFHLTERAKSYPNQLSGGLAQRVQIARAIAHSPQVLFLDEPSAGLDPQSRIAMWESVQGLHEHGITVVLTTHYMEEADALCDRIAIIDNGRILVEDTPEALKGSLGASTIYELDLRDVSEALRAQFAAMPGVTAVEPTAKGLRLLASGNREGLLPQVVNTASNNGLLDLRITEPTLETVFIRMTGRELRE